MRLLFTLIGCWLTLVVQAQTARQNLTIQTDYEQTGQYLEQAVETIEAVNSIGTAATVEYRAGQSVTMLPGFQAKPGSRFTATIKPVTETSDLSLRLTAFPNPFERSTVIDYNLPTDGRVSLWITDAQGKVVEVLMHASQQSAGKHRIEWTPQSLASGVYLPVLEVNEQRATSRLIRK